MKKAVIIVLLSLTFPLLFSSALVDNLRFSAPTSSNNVIVRGELDIFYDLSFYTLGATGPDYHNFELIEASDNSYEALLPAPTDNDIQIGIRAYNDVVSETYAGVAVQPIPWNSEEEPLLADLNWLCNDGTGDSAVAETFLDITASYFTYNDEKLYFSMQNSGGGYPIRDAIWGPFYSYIAVIAPADIDVDPDNIDFTAFGLLYTVNQAGIIQPGLYKISGMSMDDIVLIGTIETTINEANNQLTLSCNWSDLYAQADFMDWYNPDEPEFNSAFMTGMITLAGGMQEADYNYPTAIYLDPLTLTPEANTLPEIVNINSYEVDGYLYFTYFDEDGNFPLTVQALIDEEFTLDFQPQSLDFSNEVIFVSNEPFNDIISEGGTITITISDNNIDFVEETITMVSNYDTEFIVNTSSLANYPNPFNPETTLAFELKNPTAVKLDIYNLKGQKVVSLLNDFYLRGRHEVVWNGKDHNNKSVASGIYYLQMQAGNEKTNHKMILMK